MTSRLRHSVHSTIISSEPSSAIHEKARLNEDSLRRYLRNAVSHPLDYACSDPTSASRFKDALADCSQTQKHRWLPQQQFQIARPYELVTSDAINLFFKEEGGGWMPTYLFSVCCGCLTYSYQGLFIDALVSSTPD